MARKCLSRTYLALLLLTLSPAGACTGTDTAVSTLIQQQFNRYILLERRGCPESFALCYYEEFIHELVAYVQGNYPSVTNFGAACLTPADLTTFYGSYHIDAVDAALDTMYDLDHKMFYLPPANFSDASLLSLSQSEQNLVNSAWYITTMEMSKAPNPSITDTLAVLPKAVEFFYDPKAVEVSEDFEDYLDEDENSNLYWSAEIMITRVLAMVIRLEFLGVARQNSLQILKHCVAFVFNGVRIYREEEDDLPMPTVYIPWYEEAFKNLTSGLNAAIVPGISNDIIDDYLDKEVKLLSSFDSWGKLTHYSFDSSLVSLVNIEDLIFHPTVLQSIADEIGFQYSGRIYSQYSQRNIANVSDGHRKMNLLAASVRNGAQCDASLYVYHVYGTIPSTSLEACCASICSNSPLLLTVNVLTMEDCCVHCNQQSCIFHSTNPLLQLSTVHITPYGYDEDDPIPVMI